jgi:hypothetical protein
MTIAIALTMCIGMWAYVLRVANPNIARQAAAGKNRAGDLGDLYPRWYGTQQLVLYGQNPYGERVSEDLQLAYYGNVVSGGVRDEQRFAYPAYVALFLLPAVHLPFSEVKLVASILMAGAIAVSVPLWLGFIGWRLARWKVVVIVLLVLSCSPAVQALDLQQLSTIVCAFVAAACFLLRRGAYIAAGILLALATIKPQMIFLLGLWLLLWVVCGWRDRKKLLLSFAAIMIVLIGIGEWMVPGWIGQFLSAARAYRNYAGGSAQSIVEMIAGRIWGSLVGVVILLGLAVACSRARSEPPESAKFVYLVALILAVSTLVLPPAAPYNHLLLVPGVLILVRDWPDLWNSGKVTAGVSLLATAAILWPWAAAIGVLLASFFVQVRGWALPFYTSLIVPLSVTTLLILRWTSGKISLKQTT